MNESVSQQTLKRLPLYLSYLKSLPEGIPENISATMIAEALRYNHVQVRKDLSAISSSGRPKVGYHTRELICELEHFLGYDDVSDAVLVGAGKLGKALMSYAGFREYGLNILAGFDTDERVIGSMEEGKPIYGMDKLSDLCYRMSIHIGIIAVPAANAQDACDVLVNSGVLAVWNFAPVRLVVPDSILVQNENMASSLAVLSKHLSERLRREENENGQLLQ